MRIAVFFLLLPGLTTAVQDTARLTELHEQIEILQAQMADTRDHQGRLHKELRTVEKDIGELTRRVADLREARRTRETQLAELEQNHAREQALLAEQRRRLAGQIRAAYIAGRQDSLKMLLNQQDPAGLGRVLTYYDYFNRARAETIHVIGATLERLELLAANIQRENAEIAKLIAGAETRQQRLQQRHAERSTLLKNLQVELLADKNRLEQLQSDAESLAVFLRATPDTAGLTDFAALKGKLTLPVAGDISHTYGSPRSQGMIWHGLLINAPADTEVHAVAAGRVVFADWLRNFGQLLIVDHGQGYMSLYGHNRSLFKQAGDTVQAGDVIATVGNSGGRRETALYFEIRRQGTAVDPGPWLAESL